MNTVDHLRVCFKTGTGKALLAYACTVHLCNIMKAKNALVKYVYSFYSMK